MKIELDFYKFNNIKIFTPFVKSIIKGVLTEFRFIKAKNIFISVSLINDKEMKKINNKYRKQNKTTDVLSFGKVKEFSKLNHLDLGEVLISFNQCKNQAKINSIKFSDEFKMLLIHGLLHNLGYDHKNKKQEKIMISLQKKIFNKLN